MDVPTSLLSVLDVFLISFFLINEDLLAVTKMEEAYEGIDVPA